MVRTNKVDINVTRGDDDTQSYQVINNGIAYDMSTSTVIWTYKDIPTGPSLGSLTATAGVGSISVALTPTQTGSIGTFVYDIQETTSSAEIRTLVIGSMFVDQDVNN